MTEPAADMRWVSVTRLVSVCIQVPISHYTDSTGKQMTEEEIIAYEARGDAEETYDKLYEMVSVADPNQITQSHTVSIYTKPSEPASSNSASGQFGPWGAEGRQGN